MGIFRSQTAGRVC